MRGGTSRGAFLLREDLPEDQRTLDSVVLGIYGSPDTRQINGLGGGDPLTSKVAVIAPSDRPDADVDYTFGQVGIDVGEVFWTGNCGNMSSAVGPYAIWRGLVPAVEPCTRVRIFNTNTRKVLTAEVQVEDGRAREDGETAIAGVPGTGSPIFLDFGDCAGATTGKLLPTGNRRDQVTLGDGSEVSISIVDATTAFVFVSADDVHMTGTELPAEIDADPALLGRLEEVRSHAATLLGLVTEGEVASRVSPSVPRVAVVSPPADYRRADGTMVAGESVAVVGRQMAMQRTHKTYAVTGTLCTAVAASIPGTVVSAVARPTATGSFDIGHPSGIVSAQVDVEDDGGDVSIRRASLVRTARIIMDGHAHVSAATWPSGDSGYTSTTRTTP